ncbi:tRNA uridine-5-carboxymethylaminomethyl(34) synthesis GTPase MnmE [uncultured Alistipes sp.]|uniref:tRNA uridine-5-carboxymethylaminomethyl(34) synthesis GTPase MnmE n=1 Tax=uncultured Alistipes sp. TaxID=538949 RepID=UPI002622158F|nr:tRNA uridine-5-carboxymethylaminomethyl(34) synthesis GTPase MnmE [uncultured Alistipes sp.]
MTLRNETIAAVATGTGGAISVIRISGERAIEIGDKLFRSVRQRPLSEAAGFTLHYGKIVDGTETIDDVLLSVFRAPHSYTGENMIEISCHASPCICRTILSLCTAQGARSAGPGEFTLRAFLAGKMDLSQAEAVADIIAADSRAALALASNQMRGGYSTEFETLRNKLIELASLLELELDFSEEDVEFADRDKLLQLLSAIKKKIDELISSFALGNAIKNGVPVAIAGAPNVGKSTLLNAILKEEKALVSDIAGTTRDIIEDTLNIRGVLFRFIDTAGIRRTDDPLESMGIERTYDRIAKASIVLLMADARDDLQGIGSLYDSLPLREGQRCALLLNKCDCIPDEELLAKRDALARQTALPVFTLSAKYRTNLDRLPDFLYRCVDNEGMLSDDRTIVFNARHHEALVHAREALLRAETGILDRLPGDLLAQDIREIIFHTDTVTGKQISSDDILHSIFSRFCIGK